MWTEAHEMFEYKENDMIGAMRAVATSTSTAKKAIKTETDPKVDNAAREKLVTARIGLLLKAPFFGNLATRLELINADTWLPTLATDGRRFYYNSEFVNKMSLKETEFGFGHEVLHNVYDHMGRNGDRDRQIFNIAADYCVNADLIDQKIGEKITTVPILFDAKYKGWSAEEVYDDLMKNVQKIDMQKLLDMVFDEHLDGEDEGDGDGEDGDSEGKGGRPRLSEEEKKQIRDEIKEAMLAAANAVGAGNLPAGVKRLIEDMTAPVMNWRELIQQEIQSTVKSDFSWMRPSRKGWHTDAIMPGTNFGTTIDICIAADCSGSMTDEMLKEILGEVKGIMESYDDFVIHLWTFDTEVYGYKTFGSENLEEIMEYEFQGGGGTMFECNWEFMKENDIVPKKFILFTDGYPCGSWGDEDYCDTVFIIHGNKTIKPPFGIHAYYDVAKEGR